MKPTCSKCKKDIDHIGGWLSRVNPKGEDPIWECRPGCDVVQSDEQNILQAIEGETGITAFMCGPVKCDHVWDKWENYKSSDGCMTSTAICSKCGTSAINESMWL